MMLNIQKKYQNLSNGETYAYLEYGKGENVYVFVHGNMSSSVHYMPLLQRLPQNSKAYAMDMRGFGDSSYNNGINSLDDLGDDISEFMKILGISNATLVGWSTGGLVCLSIGARYNELCKKIILIESASYKGYPIPKKDSTGKFIKDAYYKDKQEMSTDVVQVAPLINAFDTNDPNLINTVWDSTIYVVNKPTKEENDIYIEETMKQRNLLDIDWSLANFNYSVDHNGYSQGNGFIKKINQPVLSFWGDKDIIVKRYMVEETINAIKSEKTLVVLKDIGHSPLVDCPDLLAQKLYSF